MARRGTSATLALDIQDRLRDEILKGLLVPGQRLMAAEQGTRLGVSQGVIREALVHLVRQRLVVLEHNHGFHVAEVSPKDLDDLSYTRKLNETAALALSLEHGGVDWEAEVVAAHHRLLAAQVQSDDEPGRLTDQWLAAHREFHNRLLQGHDNAVLYQICESLSDRAQLFGRWSVTDPVSPSRDLLDEHTELMRAALAHDERLAVELLTRHIDQTTKIVHGSLQFHLVCNGDKESEPPLPTQTNEPEPSRPRRRGRR